jgi:membrane-associated phospholipid phosphatase
VPTLAGSWLIALAARRPTVAHAIVRIGAGYVLADLTESALKGSVGRERPHVAGRPWHFEPFSRNGDEHSFPSAHVAHAMAVAAGVARESHQPLVAAAAYLGAGIVGWQRVHEDQHWLSDVGASSAIAIGAQELVARWHDRTSGHVRTSMLVAPGAVVVRLDVQLERVR